MTLICRLFLIYFIGSKNKIIRAEKYGNSHFCEVPKFVHNKHTKNEIKTVPCGSSHCIITFYSAVDVGNFACFLVPVVNR